MRLEGTDPRGRLYAAALVLVVACGGCGKRGDPLPPLRPVPSQIADLAIRRNAERIQITLTVPASNADGTTPAAVDRVDIFGRTLPAGAPAPTAAVLISDPSNVVARVAVRRVEVVEPETAVTPAQPAGTTPNVLTPPRPGELVTVIDRSPALTAPPAVPVPPSPNAVTPAVAAPPTVPAGPATRGVSSAASGGGEPTTPGVPTRYYVAVGVAGTGQGRLGPASAVVAVSLGDLPPAPAGVSATYDERRVLLSWQPAVSGQRFRVLRTGPTFDPLQAQSLTTLPLSETSFEQPVEFGTQVCFVIQTIQGDGAVVAEGIPSPVQCLQPTDSYPPPVPAGLQAIQEAGGVTLIWTGVTAADLAGYVVVRGDPAGPTLQPLTPQPVTATTYRDTTAQPGASYAYAVYAVDRASPPNASAPSARQVLTVR